MPFPYQLLALDLDGTTLRDDKTISARVATAIARVRQTGTYVVIATGRLARTSRLYHAQLGLDTPLINCNGAVIQAADSDEPLRFCPLPNATTALLAQLFDELGAREAAVSTRSHYLVVTRDMRGTIARLTAQQPELMPNGIIPPELCDGLSLAKISVWVEPAEVDRAVAHATQRLGTLASVTASGYGWFDIMAPGVSKGSGLAWLAKQLGVPRQAVMAVGDAGNDLEMLRWAGHGVAMDNAPAWVKAVAAATCPSNEEDGLAVALEQLLG